MSADPAGNAVNHRAKLHRTLQFSEPALHGEQRLVDPQGHERVQVGQGGADHLHPCASTLSGHSRGVERELASLGDLDEATRPR